MKPTAFILNVDDHTKGGSHWISIYVNKSGEGFYFDSFGFPPFEKHHINRLRKNCKVYRWNSMQLQSEYSTVCGQYCVMFLNYMTSGLGFQKFIENFSSDLTKNDEIVEKFVKYKIADGEFFGNGCCFVRCVQNSCSKMSLI